LPGNQKRRKGKVKALTYTKNLRVANGWRSDLLWGEKKKRGLQHEHVQRKRGTPGRNWGTKGGVEKGRGNCNFKVSSKKKQEKSDGVTNQEKNETTTGPRKKKAIQKRKKKKKQK